MDWKQAVRRSFQVKKPADGRLDTVKKSPTKKRGPKQGPRFSFTLPRQAGYG